MCRGTGASNKKKQRRNWSNYYQRLQSWLIIMKIYGLVQTDASQEGLGAVLLQDGGEGPRPISYISRGLNDVKKRQHCNELECLALVWALEKFRLYVYGKRFKVETDSSAVKWLFSKKKVRKFGRWVLALQEYDFEVCHIRRKTNSVADRLSRNPLVETTDGFSMISQMCSFVCKVKLPTGLEKKDLRFQQQVDPQIRLFFLLCKTNKILKIFLLSKWCVV